MNSEYRALAMENIEIFDEHRKRARRNGERRDHYSWCSYMWRNSDLAEFDRRQGHRREGADRREPVEDAILIWTSSD